MPKVSETIINISSFSDFRHLWQLISVSEIGNFRVSNHVVSPKLDNIQSAFSPLSSNIRLQLELILFLTIPSFKPIQAAIPLGVNKTSRQIMV